MTFPRIIVTSAIVGCLLAACASTPSITLAIQGKYELRGRFFAGERIELRDGIFTYSYFSDAVDSPAVRGMPVSGRYTLHGTTIVFHHPRVVPPKRTLVKRFGKFTLWTSRQLAEFHKTGKTPHDILYQVR